MKYQQLNNLSKNRLSNSAQPTMWESRPILKSRTIWKLHNITEDQLKELRKYTSQLENSVSKSEPMDKEEESLVPKPIS